MQLPSSVRGFSLPEIMVSLLVLALGVIGSAALQMTALRTSRDATHRAIALELAADLGDRMRANHRAMALPDAANPYLGVDYRSTMPPRAAGSCHGTAAACDPARLAASDLSEWQARIRAALPPARAVVCRDAAPWAAEAGRLRWDCSGDAAAPVVVKIGWRQAAAVAADAGASADAAPDAVIAVAAGAGEGAP